MNPKLPALKYIVRSQVILYFTFVLCIVLASASLADNSGFSYFGRHKLTIIPFGAGLLASAYYLLKAASSLKDLTQHRLLRLSLTVVAPLMAGIVVVPAIGDSWYDLFHRLFGSSLFVIQLCMASWLVWQARKSPINWLILALQVTGGIISLVYLHPARGFELQGQLLFQVGFTIILLKNLPKMLSH